MRGDKTILHLAIEDLTKAISIYESTLDGTFASLFTLCDLHNQRLDLHNKTNDSAGTIADLVRINELHVRFIEDHFSEIEVSPRGWVRYPGYHNKCSNKLLSLSQAYLDMTDETFQDIHPAVGGRSSSRITFALNSVDAWLTSREFDLIPDPQWQTRSAAVQRSKIRLEGVLTGHLEKSAITISLRELSRAISGGPTQLETRWAADCQLPGDFICLFKERGWLYFAQGDYASAHADFDLIKSSQFRGEYDNHIVFGMWTVTLEMMATTERQLSRINEIWSRFENAKEPRSIYPVYGQDPNDPKNYLHEADIKLKLSAEMIYRGWKHTAEYLCNRDLPSICPSR